MYVSVIGAGYVGIVTAVCLAKRGHDVALIESNPARLRTLAAGEVPFHEPGLSDLFAEVLERGLLRISSDNASDLKGRDALLVCVGTPLLADGEADLTQVRAACEAIAAEATPAVVVVRSTLPLGSTDSVASWLGRPDLEGIATNPEFLRQGTAIHDFQHPTRIVIGTVDGKRSRAAVVVEQLYEGTDAPVVITDLASAEMIKNAANAFLAMKLSFINEIADLCEVYGAEIEAVVAGIGLDPRIGPSYLRPGIGFGGSCLPKELANLVRLGQARGLPMHMFDAATRANDDRPSRTADRLERVVGGFAGCSVALLGLAFKGQTDDTRYSPAIALARELLLRGALVRAHDPHVDVLATRSIPNLARAADPTAAVEDADLVILATDWPLYRSLDWADLARRARRAVLFDGRNWLDQGALQAAGWRVIRVGSLERESTHLPA